MCLCHLSSFLYNVLKYVHTLRRKQVINIHALSHKVFVIRTHKIVFCSTNCEYSLVLLLFFA